MGNNSSSVLFILLLIGIVVFGIPYFIRKKQKERSRSLISMRHNKDEVWRTIKQYLKDMNRYGEEIIDSYVAKRNPIDYINPSSPRLVRINQRQINLIREFQYKQEKNKSKLCGEKVKFVRPRLRDLYVVCFITKNIKTNIVNEPEVIECEVIVKHLDKKNVDRNIVINGRLDYEQEIQWLAPLRFAEYERTKKFEKKQDEKHKKILKQMEKIKKREIKKNKKSKSKAIKK